MDIQPAKQSVKRWPVRAAPPKAESAGVDPMPPSAGPIRGARAPFCVLWLFVPTVLLLLGSAYWLSILWAHALIQAEATAAIVEGQRVIWGVAAGGGLLLTLALVLAVITTSRRYAGHVKSLRTQLSQRAKTVESSNRQLQEALETNDRRDNELNRLLEVAEAVGGAVTEEELYGTVAQAAARACGVDRCSILLRDSAGESLVPVTRRFAEEGGNGRTEGFPDSPPSLGFDTLPRMIVDVVHLQQPAVLSEEENEPAGSSSWLKLFQARSALVVPLVHQGMTAVVLSLEHLHAARAFSKHQI